VQGRGLADVPSLPVTHVLYSVFVTGVACVTVALIGAYLSESLKTVGARLEVASEQVADLQEVHQVVVRSMHSGLMTADLAGRLLFINEFGQSILGRPAEAMRGQPIGDIMGTRLLEAPALRARAAHEDLDRMEFPYRRPDGLELELGISVSPLATADPAFGAYLLVFQNLTRLKRLEQEIRTKEKLAAVGEMAAQLAHEIRNPLGSISGSAQVLMEEKTLSIEQNHLLAIIVRESKRLSGTLNQFLFQVRPSAAPRGPVDLGRVLKEAVTLLQNGAEVRPNHEVVFEMDEGPHVCLGDPDQILQVFWNLTRNALEAMPLGGTLRIEVRRRGDTLVLLCRDHGRGISREEQRRIFEPYQSGSPVGTGLGLAIVYQIVREHGGDIAVKSTPGQGTDVEVRLPLLNTPVPA
jgi:two-component system sensor histidine kinase PilS (NtrC family)